MVLVLFGCLCAPSVMFYYPETPKHNRRIVSIIALEIGNDVSCTANCNGIIVIVTLRNLQKGHLRNENKTVLVNVRSIVLLSMKC